MSKSIYALLIVLFFNSCASNTAAVIKRPNFIIGEKDGCTTAKGDYKKNSNAFRMDADYQNGWFYGRRRCNRT